MNETELVKGQVFTLQKYILLDIPALLGVERAKKSMCNDDLNTGIVLYSIGFN